MKRVLAVIRSERQSYIEVTLVMFGLLVLFAAIEIGGIVFFNEDEWVPLTNIGVGTLGALGLMLFTGLQFALSYNRALRYGVIRKKALLGAMGSNLVLGLIFWAVTLVATIVEAGISLLLFPGELRTEQMMEMMRELPSVLIFVIPGVLVGYTLWSLIVGVLLLKYGKAVFWGWYVIFFGGMFLMSILQENAFVNRLISKIPALSPIHWIILGAVVVVALLVYAVRTAFRMEVLETFG